MDILCSYFMRKCLLFLRITRKIEAGGEFYSEGKSEGKDAGSDRQMSVL